ncbi:hypothetical protein RI129_002722 [Pyrocoelia pectoralis]|uniref:Uncharacterized protein n=1 Tax=Pyrocoelia pectoralis TaxID=417401 RepID=A0AAN7VFT3_9COLE
MEGNCQKFNLIVDENGETIIQDKKILLQDIGTTECIYMALTSEIIEYINLTNYEIHKKENGETKLWTTDNTLFLIDQIKKYDEEFSNGIKKKCLE